MGWGVRIAQPKSINEVMERAAFGADLKLSEAGAFLAQTNSMCINSKQKKLTFKWRLNNFDKVASTGAISF